MKRFFVSLFRRLVIYSLLFLAMVMIFGHGNMRTGACFVVYYTRIWCNTRLISHIEVGNLTVDVYIEKGVVLRESPLLGSIVYEAYKDFPKYLNELYPDLADMREEYIGFGWQKKPSHLNLIIVSEPTYALRDHVIQTSTNGMYVSEFKSAYIRGKGYTFNVVLGREVIRHELFHHFWHIDTIDDDLNEWNAFRFQDFR
jgi:hypothetical protein